MKGKLTASYLLARLKAFVAATGLVAIVIGALGDGKVSGTEWRDIAIAVAIGLGVYTVKNIDYPKDVVNVPAPTGGVL